MIDPIRIRIDAQDEVLRTFGNQLAAVGAGKARVAMARAVNYGGRQTAVAVKRALVAQTSIPKRLIEKAIQTKAAAHKGDSAIEFTIWARTSELPLRTFQPKQFSFGVRAKVWGKMQKYPGMFMGPKPGAMAIKLRGHVFVRTSADRFPIEKTYGPSIAKEMVIDNTAETFKEKAREATMKRLRHELGRMLDGK